MNRAMLWYKQSADSGEIRAQFSLANLYYQGNVVAQDYPQAEKYYTLAATQGHDGALF